MTPRDMPAGHDCEKPFVCVHWHDAADKEGAWTHHEDAEAFGREPCLVISRGWLVTETDDYLTLAGDFIPGAGIWSRVTKIPAGMIQSVEVMKPKPKRKAKA